jgi:phosphatidylethanolamine-binding protein (PEBP) family uncharacterized protein
MRTPTVLSCVTLIAALAVAGCGGSGSASVTSIQLKSPAIGTADTIPALYTCDGKDIPPTLEWGAVPSDTGELVLLVVGLQPTAIANKYSISVEWAVAGINPALHKLTAGQLPPGAHVGLSSDGQKRYSVCPKKGVLQAYQFALYAMPTSAAVLPNFEGISFLASLNQPNKKPVAIAHGTLVAVYKRP